MYCGQNLFVGIVSYSFEKNSFGENVSTIADVLNTSALAEEYFHLKKNTSFLNHNKLPVHRFVELNYIDNFKLLRGAAAGILQELSSVKKKKKMRAILNVCEKMSSMEQLPANSDSEDDPVESKKNVPNIALESWQKKPNKIQRESYLSCSTPKAFDATASDLRKSKAKVQPPTQKEVKAAWEVEINTQSAKRNYPQFRKAAIDRAKRLKKEELTVHQPTNNTYQCSICKETSDRKNMIICMLCNSFYDKCCL